jgi:hypothetical protein
VDQQPQYSGSDLLEHYGSPLVTQANTVIVPVKTGATGGFEVTGRSGATGALLWTETTDYVLPPHNWVPSYSPAMTPAGTLYYPGAGGTIYYVHDVDPNSPHPSPPVQLAYYGLANYQANPAAYNGTVYINTPITADQSGNIFFGVRVTGANPANLTSGIVRIDVNGNATWVDAAHAMGDPNIKSGAIPHNMAPALSNDGKTLYVGARDANTEYNGYLLGLDSTTLATKYKVYLRDPRSGGANPAGLLDDGTSSPMVGPDGDVYYGIFGNPYNGSRGWLAHFDSTLTVTKHFGAFGWDSTPALVPASMAPMYHGSSTYLLFEKYNNYAGTQDGGDGVNLIALLDPNATMTEPHASSGGLKVMNVVMSTPGPTPDAAHTGSFPNAVREWCINTALVDPASDSIVMPSEDGNLYRWNLVTCALSQVVTVNAQGIGEAYVPTLEGQDGTVYTIENAQLFAVGGLAGGLAVTEVTSAPDGVAYGQPVTFTATVTSSGSPAPGGSVTFKDGSTVLQTVTLSGNQAATTTSALSAGRHFITASYSGDPNYGPGSMTLVQAVAQGTTTAVASSADPSGAGDLVTFTATVKASGPTANVPEGTVTFKDGSTVLGTATLTSNGQATLATSALGPGIHTVTASYGGGHQLHRQHVGRADRGGGARHRQRDGRVLGNGHVGERPHHHGGLRRHGARGLVRGQRHQHRDLAGDRSRPRHLHRAGQLGRLRQQCHRQPVRHL